MPSLPFARFCAVGVVVVACAIPAKSSTIDLLVSWRDAGDRDGTWTTGEPVSGDVIQEGDYLFVSESRAYPGWDIDWDLTIFQTANRESVTSSMAVTNNTAAPQVFSFSNSTTAMTDIGAPTLVITSLSLTVADGNGDGATVADDGVSPIYRASLNSSQLATLGDPLTLTAGAELTNSTTESNSFGGGPAVVMGDMLTIDNTFLLSPGDTATLVSTFAIVPEPATLILCGGMMLMVGARRRRRP